MFNNIKITLSILNSRQKKFLLFLFILTILNLVLELLSLNVLWSYMNFLTNPAFETNSFFIKIIKYIVPDKNYALSAELLFFCFIFIFLFKNFFFIYIKYFESKYVSKVKMEINNRMYNSYIMMPYHFFFKENIPNIFRNLNIEVHHFSIAMASLVKILIELVIIIGISLYLLTHNFFITLILLICFSIFGSIFYLANSKKIQTLGRERPNLHAQRLKIINQTFLNIKFFKLRQNETNFENDFNKLNYKIFENSFITAFINSIPRPFFEIFVLLILTFVALAFSFNISILMNAVPTVALYIAATYRIMPSFTNLVTNLQLLQYNAKSSNIIKEVLNLSNSNDKTNQVAYLKTKKEIFEFNKIIQFKDVDFFYGKNNKDFHLKKVNLEINKNEHVGIIGDTGSGKSSIINLLLGILVPISGQIIIDHKFSIFNNLRLWKKNIGYVPQDIFLNNSSIIENVAYGIEKEKIDITKVKKAIQLSKLDKFVETINNTHNAEIGENGILISGGQKQRLAIARALHSEPKVLILDEATSSLDKKTEIEIFEELNQLKSFKTLITVTHNSELKKYFDKIYKINKSILDRVK